MANSGVDVTIGRATLAARAVRTESVSIGDKKGQKKRQERRKGTADTIIGEKKGIRHDYWGEKMQQTRKWGRKGAADTKIGVKRR